MKHNRLCYISRNYYNLTSAGNKAKTDYERILDCMGATNIGLPCRASSNKIQAFFYNLLSIAKACLYIRRGDVILLQYPVKKYFAFLCNAARLKGASTVFGEYLKYNTPHKASFYLRAGLPIIVWRQSAIAQLVEERNAGIAVNSLTELTEVLKSVTPADYKALKASVRQLA